MDKKYEALFTLFRIGTCEIKNRVIIPAVKLLMIWQVRL